MFQVDQKWARLKHAPANCNVLAASSNIV